MRPYWNWTRPWVFMRPEVQVPPELRARITSCPAPFWKMFVFAGSQGGWFEPGEQ